VADLLVACVENDIREGPEWTVAPRLKLDVEQLRSPTHLGAGDDGLGLESVGVSASLVGPLVGGGSEDGLAFGEHGGVGKVGECL